jgi:hypothetical protein
VNIKTTVVTLRIARCVFDVQRAKRDTAPERLVDDMSLNRRRQRRLQLVA